MLAAMLTLGFMLMLLMNSAQNVHRDQETRTRSTDSAEV